MEDNAICENQNEIDFSKLWRKVEDNKVDLNIIFDDGICFDAS